MKAAHPYTWLGLGLLLAGAALTLCASFILGVAWLAALGLALTILGLLLLALARSIPRLPPEYSRLLFQTGSDAISDMLEELSVTSRAVYLPPSMTEGKARALIPLDGRADLVLPPRLPAGRLIVRYGPRPDDLGLLVSTPGTGALALLEPSEGLGPVDLGSSLTSLFRGVLDVAERVSVLPGTGGFTVELVRPHFEHDKNWASQSLGSPVAAITAAVAALALGKPVAIQSEQGDAKTYRIEIGVLPCASSTATS